MWVADFETTTQLDDCRVWAWAVCDINKSENVDIGNSIDSFMEYITKKTGVVYFHNLKFDGDFLLSYMLRRYKHSTAKKLKVGEFSTLISDKGVFYEIVLKVGKKKTLRFRDSLKLLPFKVEKIAKDFGLEESKLTIDYNAYREPGHILTKQEEDYIKADVIIVAKALKTLVDKGFKRMTIGGNAMEFYKDAMGKMFKYYFPTPENDHFIRKSYKGGWTYCNPKFAGNPIGCGIVLDVNSLYPSVMRNEANLYPIGNGVYYTGKYEDDPFHQLYVQRIITSFKIKPNHFPTIQIKGSMSVFAPTEYITDSGPEPVELTLTCVDLKLFLEQYDVEYIEYVDGYKYQGKAGLFSEYIDYWTEQKVNAKKTGNKSLYVLAKLMLNNLYGKFSTNPIAASKYPFLKDDGSVGYKDGEQGYREPVYIPVGTFVTAYARNVTIRAAQANHDRFLYADTDSLHLIGNELPEGMDIDPVKLGAWDLEMHFVKAKYLRAKTYMEYEIKRNAEGFKECKWKITCAGMPAECYKHVTFDNFVEGQSYPGKLKPVHVKGGTVLIDTLFTIRKSA